MPKNTRVLIPILDIETINFLKSHKKLKLNNEFADTNRINLEIGKISDKFKKKKVDTLDYNNLLELGLVTIFQSDKLFKDVISIGKDISIQLCKVEDKHNFVATGYTHFEKSIENFKDEILTDKIFNKCSDLFADKYNCSIYQIFTKNKDILQSSVTLDSAEQFLMFCYRTYEMLLLFIGDDTFKNRIDKKKSYYSNTFDNVIYLDKYLNDYREYDTVRFYLIKNKVDSIGEYSMTMCADSIITPAMFGLKCEITDDGNGITKKYTTCRCCGNLFEATRKGQLYCFNKECKKVRNRHYKGY